ncbi:MAG: DUF3887 domain-containing protein [Firmicutes bacterium]|jgi:hypothetical protein|nr:DUF3887 domain-containing protein [Bacillota bacterium]HPU02070.1 DUF3887 domain-containing protein [Bacillota bacterium]
MAKTFPVLLLALLLSLAAVSCAGEELPPLEGKPAELAEAFFQCLVNGHYEECTGYFSKEMKRALPAWKLKQAWNELQNQAGQFVKKAEMREDKIEGYDVVFVTAEFEHDLVNIRIVFDDDRRVAGLWIEPIH